jgi:bacterial/archaeal transporter family-2 protein
LNNIGIILAVLAGVALVTQNTIMAAMTERGLALTSVLLFNSLVGVLVLIGFELMRAGTSFTIEFAHHAKFWFVLPGLLGTFFVFASLYGYMHMGATTTIALIIASQLVAGIVFDTWALHSDNQIVFNFQKLLGVNLLAIGAFMVLQSS